MANPLEPIDTTLDESNELAATPGINDLASTPTAFDPSVDGSQMVDRLPMASPQEFSNITSQNVMNFHLTDSGTADSGAIRQNVVKYAQKFLGTPYVWGGSQPGGFDCSGFTQYVAKQFGLNIPRLSYSQAAAGQATHDMKALQPGDLVIMSGGEHVGMYVGGGKIIEAPHTGASVRVRALGRNEQWMGVHLNYPGENRK
jgi:cell wall-associated NlpC family hydrolase